MHFRECGAALQVISRLDPQARNRVMKIGEICTRDVTTVRRTEGVLSAARRMRDQHVGALVVMDDDEESGQSFPIGILTDRDVVVGVLAKDWRHLDVLEVGDVVTRELVTARADEDIDDTLPRMRAAGVRRVPVVRDDGTLAGIVSLDDILSVLVENMTELARLVARQREIEVDRRPI